VASSGGAHIWTRCAAGGRGDEDTAIRFTLCWALTVVQKGLNPGPPGTWEGRFLLTDAALEGMAVEADGGWLTD
jgi:hypothetical protein